MSKQLRDLVKKAVLAEEGYGVERVAVRAGVSPSTIRAILKDGHVPSPQRVKKVALACGLKDKEATALAFASFDTARETA